jgi:uncharacterized protein YdiU (UPF0061 family)
MSLFKNSQINNTFSNLLPGDVKEGLDRRQVFEACYSFVNPLRPKNPSIIHASLELAKMLKVDASESEFLQIVSGQKNIDGSKPYAMCYGGHQFGNWAGQLGDGRAINIGEIENENGRLALQLKGAGQTPYSRGADGLAVLRSSIREYLCSEAMYHLGVPTTRALSISLSGEEVMRDMLYDGNPALEKSAIVCRTAESFVRFGNFEIFASRQDKETLTKLVDYTITQFFPHLGPPNKESYLAFFQEVVDSTKAMIIHWQRVGFVHGVMNTDNMSILGLTIDYGPYGWLEDYDPNWTPNTTDAQHKRYRYGNQSSIGLWNLTQLANALYPLIEEVEPLQTILRSYKYSFQDEYLNMMLDKIGLPHDINNGKELVKELQQLLEVSEVDMTLFFRNLSSFDTVQEFLKTIEHCSYKTTGSFLDFETQWKSWLKNYSQQLEDDIENSNGRKLKMNLVNPKYVLRNYMAQLVIDDANKGDYKLLNDIFEMLKHPYDEQPKNQKWFAKRPDWAKEKVGCSMLSCSS